MPPFKVKVEVIPHSGQQDPESVTLQRQVYNSPLECAEGVTSLQKHQLVTFTINCLNKEEALDKTQEMCNRFLVNPVLASSNIEIEAAPGFIDHPTREA